MDIRALISLLICVGISFADEGMWTFDNLPLGQLKQKYGWEPDRAWLDKASLASVKFPGGSGAFVSSNGLILTNHHIARGSIARISTPDRDLLKDGFVAASYEQEIAIPNYELRILLSTRNVTELVNSAVASEMDSNEANKARKDRLEQTRAALAKEDGDKSYDAVTLYNGGEYWIYCYKKFTDIRLVAAPELQVADFGGSHDNYTYPRWSLDFALLRAYENGKPYRPEKYLPWAVDGIKAGDLVIVSGHPGATFRQATLAQMEFARDFTIPARMRFQERQKAAIQEYGKSSASAARQAMEATWGIDNGYKRISGQLMGLNIPANISKVASEEEKLRAKVASDPKLRARAGESWAQIASAIAIHKQLLNSVQMLDGRGSALLGTAINLVRWADDASMPLEKRPSISDEALNARKNTISRQRNVDIGLDIARLQAGFEEAVEVLGSQHAIAKTLTGGKTPEKSAKDALTSTQFNNEEFRKKLLDGGKAALESSKDPLIVLARNIEAIAKPIRKQMDEQVFSVILEHSQRIAEARFAIHGKTFYPDATNTLRFTFGPVATYPANGTLMQPFTTFHGLLDRYQGWGGNEAGAEGGIWTLPKRWLDRLPSVNMAMPYNFVYACDTVGGNSGSPVINTKGEVVGVNFDSNMEGQAGYYVYDGNTKRSIAVDSRAIIESLEKVMDGKWIADELTAR
jgi:hypothetical protein